MRYGFFKAEGSRRTAAYFIPKLVERSVATLTQPAIKLGKQRVARMAGFQAGEVLALVSKTTFRRNGVQAKPSIPQTPAHLPALGRPHSAPPSGAKSARGIGANPRFHWRTRVLELGLKNVALNTTLSHGLHVRWHEGAPNHSSSERKPCKRPELDALYFSGKIEDFRTLFKGIESDLRGYKSRTLAQT